jgi:hypothetical protein
MMFKSAMLELPVFKPAMLESMMFKPAMFEPAMLESTRVATTATVSLGGAD